MSCRACSKNVNNNHDGIFCDSCNSWIHRKCNKLTRQDYDKLSNEGEDVPFICICCLADNIPFSNLTDKNFNLAVIKGVNYQFDDLDNDLHVLSKEQLNIRATLRNSLFLVAGLSQNRVGRSAKKKIFQKKKILNFFFSGILSFICIFRN